MTSKIETLKRLLRGEFEQSRAHRPQEIMSIFNQYSFEGIRKEKL